LIYVLIKVIVPINQCGRNFKFFEEGDRFSFDTARGQKGLAAENGTVIRPYVSRNGGIPSNGEGVPLQFFYCPYSRHGGDNLARSNYQFNKRQKELARKKKKAEKRQSRLEKSAEQPDENAIESQDEKDDSSVKRTDEKEKKDASKIHDIPRSQQKKA
jgi:hypothetical protein